MIDLDSLDLFLDYHHGPNEPQELAQLVQPLSISFSENLDLFSDSAERETNSTNFNSYFPGNFGHVILPLEMGRDSSLYYLKIVVILWMY